MFFLQIGDYGRFLVCRVFKETEAYTTKPNCYYWYRTYTPIASAYNEYFGLFNQNSQQVDFWIDDSVEIQPGTISSDAVFDPARIDFSYLFPNFYN